MESKEMGKVLLDIKNTLSKKKSERDMLLGKKESLLDQLKALGHHSVTSAEEALEKLDTKIVKDQKALEIEIQNFQEQYQELL